MTFELVAGKQYQIASLGSLVGGVIAGGVYFAVDSALTAAAISLRDGRPMKRASASADGGAFGLDLVGLAPLAGLMSDAYLNVGPLSIEQLEWGGLLHDIGKIGVRDAVLLKPGRLDREERMLMNEHPVKGAEILKGVKKLAPELQIIRHHHEWYNGSGYPDRLVGEQILYLACILRVADAFEAMTASRPYRPIPLTQAQAMDELDLRFLLHAGPLGDIIPVRLPFTANVVSLRDVLIGLGLGWFLFSTLLSGDRVAEAGGVSLWRGKPSPVPQSPTFDRPMVVGGGMGPGLPMSLTPQAAAAPGPVAGRGIRDPPMSGSRWMPASAPSGWVRRSACSAIGCTRWRWA